MSSVRWEVQHIVPGAQAQYWLVCRCQTVERGSAEGAVCGYRDSIPYALAKGRGIPARLPAATEGAFAQKGMVACIICWTLTRWRLLWRKGQQQGP